MDASKLEEVMDALDDRITEATDRCNALEMSLEEANELAICDIDELVKHLEAAPLQVRWQGTGLLQSEGRHARCRYCGSVVLSQSKSVEVKAHHSYCWYGQAKALAKKFRDRGKEEPQTKTIEECAFPDGRKNAAD